MKKVLMLMLILALVISVFAGCDSNDTTEEYPLEGSWKTTGNVLGLGDGDTMDVYLNFIDDTHGNLTYVFSDGREDVLDFEYVAEGNNLVFTANEGKPLAKGEHVYPYEIKGDILAIEARHQVGEYTRVK